VAAACVAVLALVAGVALAARPDPQRAATTTSTTTTTLPPGTWRAIAQPGLSPREDAPSIWTGKEWLLFGGRQGNAALADGAAYDPSTDRWRSLSPPISMHPGAIAVWTGHDVAVLAKQGGWTYDPVADTWSDLPLQETTGQTVFASTAVWTGHEVVVIGWVLGSSDDETLAARTLDAADRTWGPATLSSRMGSAGRAGPDGIPGAGAIAGARWDGTRVQVWLEDGSGLAYDPANAEWSQLPSIVGADPYPATRRAFASIGPTTYALVSTEVSGGSTHQLARFEDDRWTLVGAPQETSPPDVACQLTAAGNSLVRFCAHSLPSRIDPATGDVHTYLDPAVGPGTGRSLAWTGSELLVFGGRDTAPPGATGSLDGTATALTP
jgi:hypothetical protein